MRSKSNFKVALWRKSSFQVASFFWSLQIRFSLQTKAYFEAAFRRKLHFQVAFRRKLDLKVALNVTYVMSNLHENPISMDILHQFMN